MNNLTADNKNRRVLIIDDNRSIHDDFRKILSPASNTTLAFDASKAAVFGSPTPEVRQAQFEIDSAYQGQEGVLLVKQALAAGRPYALAFVDVRMPPGWDGVETTQKMWAIDPDLQIVICTAYSDYSWDEMFEKIGNCDGLVILKKPFDNIEALQLAYALTEKWWLHLQAHQKLEDLESRVAERTRELRWKTAFLEAQVNSSIDGILVVDELGKQLLQNQRMTDLWKIPQPIADEKDDANRLRWVANMAKNPEQFSQRVGQLYAHRDEISSDEIELKDGTLLDRYSAPVLGKDGKYYGRIWTFRDITERRRVERELKDAKVAAVLREGEKRYSFLADSVRLIIWTARPDGGLDYYNKAWFDYSGLSLAQTQDWGWGAVLHPDDLQRCVDRWTRSFNTGEDYEIEYRFKRAADGIYRWFLGRATARRNEAGEIVQWVGTCTDIDDQKRTRSELERRVTERTAELAKTNAALQQQQAELLESKRFLQSTLNALSSHIAILDEQGTIVEVNAAWNRFATENIFRGRDPGVGDNYLQVCDSATGNFCDEAPLVARGIRAVMAGESDEFQLEYPCHSPREKRWFVVRATRFGGTDRVRVVVAHENITERRQAENLVRQSQERYRSLIDNARDAIFTISTDGMFTSLNPAAEIIGGLSRARWIGKPFAPMVHPDDLPLAREMFNRIMAGEQAPVHELRGNPSLKRPALMEMTLAAQKDDSGKIIGLLGIGRDITERKRLEARLFQSQKMETVGKLAGGIAHEFNSLLTAIIGQGELLLLDLPAGSPLIDNVTEISKAAGRAATLTRQLLAYGRKQMLQPEILDLNRVIAGMEGMFHHLLGSEVDTQIVPAAGLQTVKADAGQIEQVIINMAINARDAMPGGGKLILETANVSFDLDDAGRYPELKPGDYVMLAITDTGTGMSAEVKARVFEPFFTTKGVGQGSGLGLSTCYGIVKQSGGHISVYSELSRGTTFKIYLPQVESPVPHPVQRLDLPGLPRGTETILLAEDDPALREMAATLLRRLGYKVLTAANGVEALSLHHEQSHGHIDLLFTDVVMPHMSGKELADRVRALYPRIKILFTSAYTENAIVHQGVLNKGVALLQKPFTPSALACKLREVLDQPNHPKPVDAPKHLDSP